MPVTRLYPNATTPGGALATNAASHHAGLSDANDGSYSSGQLSSSEPAKFASGPSLTQLPTSAGKVKGVTVNARAYQVGGDGGGDLQIVAGENGENRLSAAGPITSSVAEYSSAQVDMGSVSTINALGWVAGFTFIDNNGVEGRFTELNFDVEWYATSGFTAFIIELLGPMTALGLWEMPRLSAELGRISRTRLLRTEIERTWRDLCTDPRRRHFVGPFTAGGSG